MQRVFDPQDDHGFRDLGETCVTICARYGTGGERSDGNKQRKHDSKTAHSA